MEELDFHQDNMSAILMENNRKESRMNQKKHTQLRYFIIKDLIENGYLSLKYCMIGKMFADFFTKPMQGSTFRIFQDMI